MRTLRPQKSPLKAGFFHVRSADQRNLDWGTVLSSPSNEPT